MNPKARSILIQVLLLGAGILMLYLAFKGQDLGKLLSDMRSADYRYVGWSLLVLLLAHFIRAIRWKMLIEPLGFKPTNASLFSAVMIGYLANLAVPRLGEITRCGIISRTDKAPVDQLIGTVIMERLADVILLLFGMVLTLITQYDVLKEFFFKQVLSGLLAKGQSSGPFLIKLLIVLIMLLGIGIFIFRKKKDILMDLGPVRKVSLFLKGILAGFKTISKMTQAPLFVFYSLLIWSLYALSTGLVFKAIPSTSSLPFLASLFVLTAGSVGMVAPVQGGIGAYHFMVTQALLLLQIPATEGLAYATINHSSQLLLFLFAGGLCLMYILLFSASAKKNLAEKPEKAD